MKQCYVLCVLLCSCVIFYYNLQAEFQDKGLRTRIDQFIQAK